MSFIYELRDEGPFTDDHLSSLLRKISPEKKAVILSHNVFNSLQPILDFVVERNSITIVDLSFTFFTSEPECSSLVNLTKQLDDRDGYLIYVGIDQLEFFGNQMEKEKIFSKSDVFRRLIWIKQPDIQDLSNHNLCADFVDSSRNHHLNFYNNNSSFLKFAPHLVRTSSDIFKNLGFIASGDIDDVERNSNKREGEITTPCISLIDFHNSISSSSSLGDLTSSVESMSLEASESILIEYKRRFAELIPQFPPFGDEYVLQSPLDLGMSGKVDNKFTLIEKPIIEDIPLKILTIFLCPFKQLELHRQSGGSPFSDPNAKTPSHETLETSPLSSNQNLFKGLKDVTARLKKKNSLFKFGFCFQIDSFPRYSSNDGDIESLSDDLFPQGEKKGEMEMKWISQIVKLVDPDIIMSFSPLTHLIVYGASSKGDEIGDFKPKGKKKDRTMTHREAIITSLNSSQTCSIKEKDVSATNKIYGVIDKTKTITFFEKEIPCLFTHHPSSRPEYVEEVAQGIKIIFEETLRKKSK